jgi:hypothetical protein
VFYRIIVLSIVVLFLIGMPAPMNVVYNIFNRSSGIVNIQKNLILVDKPILHGNYVLSEYILTIVNEGNNLAKDMHIALSVKQGRVLRIGVSPSVQYLELDVPTQYRTKELLFNEFTPGSTLKIVVWTMSIHTNSSAVLQVDISYYGGIAERVKPQTSFDSQTVRVLAGSYSVSTVGKMLKKVVPARYISRRAKIDRSQSLYSLSMQYAIDYT